MFRKNFRRKIHPWHEGIVLQTPNITIPWNYGIEELPNIFPSLLCPSEGLWHIPIHCDAVPYANMLGFSFSDSEKRTVRASFWDEKQTSYSLVQFYKHQKELENHFGKPSPFSTLFSALMLNKDDRVFRWRFENFFMTHLTRDRFGWEEQLYVEYRPYEK